MSRVGKKPIYIPDKVNLKVETGKIFAEGPKGKLSLDIPADIGIKIEGSQVIVSRLKENKICYSMHGMVRTCISNMIKGVNEGYSKSLEIHGVGYRAQVQGKTINLQLGYSHPIGHPIPEGVTVKTPKPNQILIDGIDKVKVGELAAEIRSYFAPEPYKGKGIRYKGEFVRKKAGKAVA